MAFSFNFATSPDDSESAHGNEGTHKVGQKDTKRSIWEHDVSEEKDEEQPFSVPCHEHSLEEIISRLPETISFSFAPIPTSLTLTARPGHGEQADADGDASMADPPAPRPLTRLLPRRELYDIRLQLMGEDESVAAAAAAAAAVGEEAAGMDLDPPDAAGEADRASAALLLRAGTDIETNVYEGGFKTWECAADLVGLITAAAAVGLHAPDEEGVADGASDPAGADIRTWLDETRGSERIVVELGCGTALPSVALFQHVLAASIVGVQRHQRQQQQRRTTFVLADYNASVLRLSSAANLVLGWAQVVRQLAPGLLPADLPLPAVPDSSFAHAGITTAATTATASTTTADENDDHALPLRALLPLFTADLAARGIAVRFLSGSWAPAGPFMHHALAPALDRAAVGTAPPPDLLLLGSETIYSPAATDGFAAVIGTALGAGSNTGADSSSSGSGSHSVRTALVAAKREYFGVGGGVFLFERAVDAAFARLDRIAGTALAGRARLEEVPLLGIGGAGGVGRAVLRVAV